jgi:PEP-CTERM motif
MITRNQKLIVVLATLSSVAFSTQAADLVNDYWSDDTFTDPASPVYSESGTDADLDGDVESTWYIAGGTMGVVTTPAVGDPQMLTMTPPATGSTSATTYFTPADQSVVLANTGEFITISWKFIPRISISTDTNSNNFRTALVESPEAARVASNAGPGASTYAGYAVWFATSGTTASNYFRLYERTDPLTSSNFLASSASWAQLATAGAGGVTGFELDEEHTFTLTITRTALGELDILTSIADTNGNFNGTGSVSISYLDASPNSFSFDTFGMRPDSLSETFGAVDFTEFEVLTSATVVPEPTTVLLLGMGATVLVFRLRRRTSRSR